MLQFYKKYIQLQHNNLVQLKPFLLWSAFLKLLHLHKQLNGLLSNAGKQPINKTFLVYERCTRVTRATVLKCDRNSPVVSLKSGQFLKTYSNFYMLTNAR